MGLEPKAVVKEVKIAEIRIGDKLLQDVMGQKDRSLLMQGTVIGTREILFLRKCRAQVKPRYSAEKYTVNLKTPGAIYNQAGEALVRAGQTVTEEALTPLLDEGFEIVPGEDNAQVFYRRNEWPDDKPWHIDQFNKIVRVETTTYIDKETGEEAADPRGISKLSVGEIAAAHAAAGASTAKVAQAAKKPVKKTATPAA